MSLVSSSERQGGAGAKLYEYEYELDSTRGRKRILNTVTIFNSRCGGGSMNYGTV